MRLSNIKGLVARSLEVDVNRRAPSSTASVVGRATPTGIRGSPSLTGSDHDEGAATSCSTVCPRPCLQHVRQPSRSELTGRARNYHHESRPLDTATSSTSYDPRRNRFTQVFGAMMDDASCRLDIERYADCVKVAQQQSDEGLTRHACQDEFDAVKDCWRRARQPLRQAPPVPAK